MIRRLFFCTLLLLTAPTLLANDFLVKDTGGKSHRLDQYRGKWVLVNFWATWCAPCLKEIPDFVKLYDERKRKDFVVLGIATGFNDPKEISDMSRKLAINYPVILEDDETEKQFGAMAGLPVSLLYDPTGKLVLKKVGPLTREAILQYLDAKR